MAATIEELQGRVEAISTRIRELDNEYAGQSFSEEARAEWNELYDERQDKQGLIRELEGRMSVVRGLAGDESHVERAFDGSDQPSRSNPGGDVWDASVSRHATNPEAATRMLIDQARRALEHSQFPITQADATRGGDRDGTYANADDDAIRGYIERLLVPEDAQDSLHSQSRSEVLARHILTTGSPVYRRAFGKHVMGRPLNQEETRALSLAGAGGGFAVPYQLDPTIIPTSNLSVNPFRAIARVENITVDEWRGVSSAGVTAAYAAEATQASDNAPTIAQPVVSTEKAQAWIPYSIEVGMDWGSLQAEMASLLQDAKDDLEASAFLSGTGTNEPFGLLTGATTTVTAGGTAAFAIADLFKLEEALGPRFRSRAAVVANRFVYNKVRQFDTAGGSGVWMDGLQGGTGTSAPRAARLQPSVLGYPAYELSTMAAALTTASKIAVLGDFRYFIIVDRIGLTVETIPHVFGAAQRPTGQRGLYAYWRNGSKVLDANAFRVLVTG